MPTDTGAVATGDYPAPSYQQPRIQTGASPAQILTAIRTEQAKLAELQDKLAALDPKDRRLATVSKRKNLMKVIQRLRNSLSALYASYTKTRGVLPFEVMVYAPQKQVSRGGLLVTVDMSMDGVYFSNPGPVVKNKQWLWVRCQITNDSQPDAGEAGRNRDLMFVKWTYPKTWTPLDRQMKGGTDEYFVSYPFTYTRIFKMPKTGKTKGNVKVSAEVYEDSKSDLTA